jgi:hypothetical protein
VRDKPSNFSKYPALFFRPEVILILAGWRGVSRIAALPTAIHANRGD